MVERRSTGPYVSLAVLCRRVDRRPDGSTDLIGLMDDVALRPPSTDDVEESVLRLNVVIALQAGEQQGGHVLAVRGQYPSGRYGPMIARLVDFDEGMGGAMLLMPLRIEVRETGVYWFDVLFDRYVITRIPLRTREGPRV